MGQLGNPSRGPSPSPKPTPEQAGGMGQLGNVFGAPDVLQKIASNPQTVRALTVALILTHRRRGLG